MSLSKKKAKKEAEWNANVVALQLAKKRHLPTEILNMILDTARKMERAARLAVLQVAWSPLIIKFRRFVTKAYFCDALSEKYCGTSAIREGGFGIVIKQRLRRSALDAQEAQGSWR